MPGTELKCTCGLTIAITFPPGMMARLRAEGACFVEDVPPGERPPSVPVEAVDDPPRGSPSRSVPPARTGRSRRNARRRPLRGLLAVLLVLGACAEETSTTWNPCDVTLVSLAPGSGPTGTQVEAVGTPFTDAWDTAVYVGSARATILSLDRIGCEAWDACVSSTGCNPCDDCDDCDPDRSQCLERVRFSVPDVDPGQVWIQVFNRRGQSNRLGFTVEPLDEDTGPQDTADTGSGDTAAADATTRVQAPARP